MIRVLVSGGAGRMGSEVVRAVNAEADMEVVAIVDPAHAGQTHPDAPGLSIAASLADTIDSSSPQIMVDFTHPTTVEPNLATALARGLDCVVGTTGLAPATLEALAAVAPQGTCLFVAPNFAIGAVLMMRFAEDAARFMPYAEIIELHHEKKADAPSGTAIRTATLIAAARASTPDVPGRETEIFDGARGASVENVPVHSVRLPGLVAHQEVVFGGLGQTLTLRHDSIDRTSFMPGVILAIRKTIGRDGLIVGLEAYLDD